jgi:hypothetical protein
MLKATIGFSLGFLVGQALAIFAFRHALEAGAIDGEGLLSSRFSIVLATETVAAALAFFVGARVGRLNASAPACLVALLLGVVTNAVTVGAYALVPPIIQGDAQLVLYIVEVALFGAAAGWSLAKFFSAKVPHAA